jgi:hypothetical protein
VIQRESLRRQVPSSDSRNGRADADMAVAMGHGIRKDPK